MNNIESQLYGAFTRMDAKKTRGGARPNTGPKLGPGGKRNKLRACLTSDVEAFWRRNGDTLGEAIETWTRKSAAFKRFMSERQQ